MRRSRSSLRVSLAALLTGAATVGALLAAGTTTAHAADTPLRDLAAAKG